LRHGYISYGDQRYTAVVLYHPEFEKSSTAEFFRKANNGNTAMGDWTKNFNGITIDGNNLLPKSMTASNSINNIFLKILKILRNHNIPCQTPATGIIDNTYFGLRDFNHSSFSPPTTGFCRLIDGTIIHIGGTNSTSGDTLHLNFKIKGYDVILDAIGVAAVRLDEKGQLRALAASSLKFFKTGNIKINLDERTDIALWIDPEGEWQGIIQGKEDEIPAELKKNYKKMDSSKYSCSHTIDRYKVMPCIYL